MSVKSQFSKWIFVMCISIKSSFWLEENRVKYQPFMWEDKLLWTKANTTVTPNNLNETSNHLLVCIEMTKRVKIGQSGLVSPQRRIISHFWRMYWNWNWQTLTKPFSHNSRIANSSVKNSSYLRTWNLVHPGKVIVYLKC